MPIRPSLGRGVSLCAQSWISHRCLPGECGVLFYPQGSVLEEKEAVLPRDLRQGHASDLSEQPLRGASSLSLQPAGSPWALSPTAQGFEEASMCRNPKFRWLPLLEGDRCAPPPTLRWPWGTRQGSLGCSLTQLAPCLNPLTISAPWLVVGFHTWVWEREKKTPRTPCAAPHHHTCFLHWWGEKEGHPGTQRGQSPEVVQRRGCAGRKRFLLFLLSCESSKTLDISYLPLLGSKAPVTFKSGFPRPGT